MAGKKYSYVVFDTWCEGVYATKTDLIRQINHIKKEFPNYFVEPKIYKFNTYSEAEDAYNNAKLAKELNIKLSLPTQISRTEYEDMSFYDNYVSCIPNVDIIPSIDVKFYNSAVDVNTHRKQAYCITSIILNDEIIDSFQINANTVSDKYTSSWINSDNINTTCMLLCLKELLLRNNYKTYYVSDSLLVIMFCLQRIYILNSSKDSYANKRTWNMLRTIIKSNGIKFICDL